MNIDDEREEWVTVQLDLQLAWLSASVANAFIHSFFFLFISKIEPVAETDNHNDTMTNVNELFIQFSFHRVQHYTAVYIDLM